MAGGGARWSEQRVNDIKRDLEDIKKSAQQSAFSTGLAQYLNEILVSFNDRDQEKVNARLAEILEALREKITGSIDFRSGGSVAKHTYVDGLSDIDLLLMVDGTGLEGRGPEVIRQRVAQLINDANLKNLNIESRTMTVTVTYDDGMEIQLLPAMRTVDGLRIPSASGMRWSDIDPEGFTKVLTKTNQSCNGKLIPTIKLIKGINANLPEQLRLSGYHIESLGIEAFKGYRGEKTTAAMLQYFFKHATELVKTPIKDRTGQSIHVDDDLGPPNSEQRKLVSVALDRVARRIEFAMLSQDVNKLKELFF